MGYICREHDLAYFIGGTQEDKNRADARLKRRIYKALRERGHCPAVAYAMLVGVALGGIAKFNYVLVGPPEPSEYDDE